MEVSKNWGKRLEVLALQTLCPKISCLAKKLRAVAREQTHTHAHTHTEKTKLRDPFFLRFIFFILIRLRMRIRSTCKNKGGLILLIFFQMKISKNQERLLQLLALGTLCPKISFLAQKLRAVAREQTRTQTDRENKAQRPLFSSIYFQTALIFACASDSHSQPNQNKKIIPEKKRSLSFVFSVCVRVSVCSRATAGNF